MPNMEARTEHRFPSQHHPVLSIRPRFSTSVSSYLQGEKRGSGRPLEQKRSETKQTEMLQRAQTVTLWQ